MDRIGQPGKYLWESMENGNARLLRVYAPNNMVEIPDSIEGHALTSIGAYCFSNAEHLPKDTVRETCLATEGTDGTHVSLIAGMDLEYLVLPDSVIEIQDLAFYNCKELRAIQVGNRTKVIGSDVFMNCHSLKTLQIRGGVEEPSGAGAILNRIASEIEVHFLGSAGGSQARLLYPEYTESYDEIAPAHIFGRNITGEGFRARQLFADDIVQLDRYDEILEKVVAEESGLTVGRLALFRLLYPVGLRPGKQREYEKYICQNGFETAKYYIDLRDREILEKMCENHYLRGDALDEAIQYCVSVEWGEGSAHLLDWKQRFAKTDRRHRYDFEDMI